MMTPQEEQLFEEMRRACAAVVENWEQGDLAAAARQCDAAAQRAREYGERDQCMSVRA
jgi:hypothetical protein